MSKYAEVIERLEKAQGPDREIDYWVHDWELRKSGLQVGLASIMAHWTEEQRFSILVSYTGSIEAALSLVRTHLPGEWIDIGGMTDSTEWECNIHTDYIEVQEHGLTAPLAVLKALFRTLEAKENAG